MSGAPFPELEDFPAARQHFVECFLKIGGVLRELLAYLRNILLEALFYLLSEELLQGSVAQSLGVLCRVIGDDIRNKGTRETLGALVRILGKERV